VERIRLEIEGVGAADIELRTERTPTLRCLLRSLPFTSCAHRWGDEVYFEVPFHAEMEGDARQEFDVGEVAFWPDGDALALFFGRTPASRDDRPRAYSKCNPVGSLTGAATMLSRVREGTMVRVVRI